jgi:hypothetical protein
MIHRAEAAIAATFTRELRASRVSRFLHVHLALAIAIGLLAFLTRAEAAGAATLWIVEGVIHGLSLSALLLGLSSAQAEADEFPVLFTQPVPRVAWLIGKAAALAVVLLPAGLALVAPAAVLGGLSAPIAGLGAAAAGVTFAFAVLGLAIGLQVRDRVRALLAGLAAWLVLLVGTGLVLLAISGAPWLPRHSAWWVGLLMANPLDALRITVLFDVEHAAFAGLDAGPLVRWWLGHAWTWLALVVTAWTVAAFGVGLAGARRLRDA